MVNLQRFDAPHLAGDILNALRPMYFSNDVAPEVLDQATQHITLESPRAIFDLTLRLHGARPVTPVRPLVLGAQADRISTPGDVRATAALYGVTPIILPGLAHMFMLERKWESVAQALLDWLERDVVRR